MGHLNYSYLSGRLPCRIASTMLRHDHPPLSPCMKAIGGRHGPASNDTWKETQSQVAVRRLVAGSLASQPTAALAYRGGGRIPIGPTRGATAGESRIAIATISLGANATVRFDRRPVCLRRHAVIPCRFRSRMCARWIMDVAAKSPSAAVTVPRLQSPVRSDGLPARSSGVLEESALRGLNFASVCLISLERL